MLTSLQSNQFDSIFKNLSAALDISPLEYEAAIKSYQFVGSWLSRPESALYRYQPAIFPQGSFLLGTMIRPVNEKDELDIDLVCRLLGKLPYWTQYDLKKIVGDELKKHGTLEPMLAKPDGRRCWTLDYEKKFHMDILPSIVAEGYSILLEKAFSASDLADVGKLAIRITDKLRAEYRTATNTSQWLLCNPFGFAAWFHTQASLQLHKSFSLNESVEAVPEYNKNKLPLQRIVQILKRHRDIIFNGDEHKPISIIITTLAAKAYRKQTNVFEGLVDVVNNMETYIEERYDPKLGRMIKWIENPVNQQENFADKWPSKKQKEDNFYLWLRKLQMDLNEIAGQRGPLIMESIKSRFGDRDVSKAFSAIGEEFRSERQNGTQRMAAGTGMLGTSGIVVPNHDFHGNQK